jgi:hypothetical protein
MKMKFLKRKWNIILLLLILLSSAALGEQQIMSLQGKVIDSTGALIDDGNVTITIWDTQTGGNLIYNSTTNFANNISNGFFDIMLGSITDLEINLSQTYYMDLMINDEDIDWDGNERKIFQSPVGYQVSGTKNFTVDTNVLYVDTLNNRVGIGTNVPNAQLEVNASNNGIGILTNGSVGIGTATPSGQLHIERASGQTTQLWTSGNDGGTYLRLERFTIDGSYFNIETGSGNRDDFYIYSNAAPNDGLVIENEGRIGLSDFSADGRLEISKIGTDDYFLVSAADDNDGDVFIVKNSGNVGIGTTTPDNLLTILGNEITTNAILHLNATDNYNTSVTNVMTLDHVLKNPVNSTGGVGVSILFRATDNASQLENIGNISGILYNSTNGSELSALTFSTRGADTESGGGHLIERLRIDGNGNVGIGTASPGFNLDIIGDVNASNYYINGSSIFEIIDNSTVNRSIDLSNYNQSVELDNYIQSGEPGSFTNGSDINVTNFVANNTLFVNGSSVGIGTATPSGQLHIERASGQTTQLWTSGNDAGVYLRLERQGNDASYFNLETGSGNREDFYIYSDAAPNDGLVIESGGRIGLSDFSADGRLEISKIGTDDYFLKNSGNVGIGTTTPDNLLTILGNEITTNAILHLNATDNYNTSVTNVMTLDHVLKNPVNSTGGVGVSILFRATDNASQLENIGNISGILYNSTNGSELSALTFSTRGADTESGGGHLIERVRIDGEGKVGINTTSPQRALQVRGGVNLSNVLYVEDNGNVGIGTTNPTDKLTVNNGDLNVTDGNITISKGSDAYKWYIDSTGALILEKT